MTTPQYRVFVDDDGFQVFRRDKHGVSAGERYAWKNVHQVLAYKRDCFGHDLICVAVEDRAGAVEITEDAEGFDAFISAMERALDGCVPFPSWSPEVAQPPFSPCQYTVYCRKEN